MRRAELVSEHLRLLSQGYAAGKLPLTYGHAPGVPGNTAGTGPQEE